MPYRDKPPKIDYYHHFELVGWEQITIVIHLWIIAGLSVAAGLGLFYAQWVAK